MELRSDCRARLSYPGTPNSTFMSEGSCHKMLILVLFLLSRAPCNLDVRGSLWDEDAQRQSSWLIRPLEYNNTSQRRVRQQAGSDLKDLHAVTQPFHKRIDTGTKEPRPPMWVGCG